MCSSMFIELKLVPSKVKKAKYGKMGITLEFYIKGYRVLGNNLEIFFSKNMYNYRLGYDFHCNKKNI